MEKIMKYLQEEINEAIESDENMDAANWGYEEGILITPNEAKKILEALRQPDVMKSVCEHEWRSGYDNIRGGYTWCCKCKEGR